MVGEIGFEPTTLWSQTRCATRLRYSPTGRGPPFLVDLGCLLTLLWGDDEGANGSGLLGSQIAIARQSPDMAIFLIRLWK